MTCAINPANTLVACGGLDNLCTVFKLTSALPSGGPQNGPKGKEMSADGSKLQFTELSQHEGYLSCCRFVNDNEIITSSGDSSCILWDIEAKEPKAIFPDHAADVMSVSIYEPNGTFVSGSVDTTARFWDFRKEKACVKSFNGHESDVNAVATFGDGQSFATGSDDSSCRMWDMRSCGQVNRYSSDRLLCGVTSISFSGSGRILFAGYDDFNCYGWETLAQNTNALEVKGHDNRVSCLTVCPNGKALATGCWDTFLRVWA